MVNRNIFRIWYGSILAKDVSRVEIKEMEWKRTKRLDSKYFNSCMERKWYRIRTSVRKKQKNTS